jgi:hypothetical protein
MDRSPPNGSDDPTEEECAMNNHLQVPFKAPFIRCGFAAAAIVMTLAVAAIIDGLAKHYSGEANQLAQQSVVIAKR